MDFAVFAGKGVGAVGEDVEFTVFVFAEGEDEAFEFAADLQAFGGPGFAFGAGGDQEDALGEDEGFGPVAEDVFAGEIGDGFAAVDIAAGDGDAVGVGVVFVGAEIFVFESGVAEGFAGGVRGGAGFRSLARIFLVEGVEAFAGGPAVVGAFGDDVNFFPNVLADVGDEKFALAGAVEGEAPGVAEAVGPDFGAGLVFFEGVVFGDGVFAGGGDVEAENFSEEGVQVLAVAADAVAAAEVVAVAAVADTEVKHIVGAEGDGAAVVVEVRLVDVEEDFLGGFVKLAVGDFEFGEAEHAVPIGGAAGAEGRGVNGEEASVLREVRVKGEAEEAAFVEGAIVEFGEAWAEVEPLFGGAAVFRNGIDDADLIADEDAVCAAERDEARGGDEAFGEGLKGDGWGGLGGESCRRQDHRTKENGFHGGEYRDGFCADKRK